MRLNENLCNYRKLKGMTQEELAEKMQVSRQSVSKWETGEAVPDLIKVIKISELLDVSIDELCGRENINYPETKQDIESQNKKYPIRNFIITIIVALVFGLSGYFLGHTLDVDKEVKEFPDTITVEGLEFRYVDGELRCKFVPSVYSHEYSYTMYVHYNTGSAIGYPVELANRMGYSTATPVGEGKHKVVLEIDNGHEKRHVMLGESVDVDKKNRIVTY